jgi:hypothetical protein
MDTPSSNPCALKADSPTMPIDPSAPATVSVKTMLMEDAVAADVLDILPTKKNQIALFTNPYKGEHEEALVITAEGKLTYLERSTASATGWAQTPVDGAPARVSEVVTLIHAFAEEVWAACVDGTTNGIALFKLSKGSVWTRQTDVPELPGKWSQLCVQYTAEAPARVFVFGLDPNGTVVRAFTNISLSDRDRWRSIGDLPLTVQAEEFSAGYSIRGELGGNYLVFSRRGAKVTCSIFRSYDRQPLGSEGVADDADSLIGAYDGVVAGTCIAYLSRGQAVFASRGHSPAGFSVRRVSGVDFRTAALWQDDERRIHLYGITKKNALQVVRQSGWTAAAGSFYFPMFAEAKDENGGSVLAVVGLHENVATIHVDTYPDARPKQFMHLDGAKSSEAFRMVTQDPTTSAWTEEKIRLPSQGQPHVVRRYACEVSLQNFYKGPVASYDVALTSTTTVEIFSNDVSHVASPQTATTLKTNGIGRISFSISADSLTPPVLYLNAVGLEKGVVIRPAAALHAYLAGEGVLPTQQKVLDAKTLEDAKAGGNPLVPDWKIKPEDAVTTFKDAFGAAAGKPAPKRMVAGYSEPQEVKAILIQTYNPNQPAFRELVSEKEVEAFALLHRSHPSYGGLWEDFLQWGSDVWQGIKRAAVRVAGVFVDLANRAAKILIWIGEKVVELGTFILKTLEDAAHVVEAVFQQVGAAVSRVVEWLTTPFSFQDVWDTKSAIESLLRQTPKLVTQVMDHFGGVADGFFVAQEEKVKKHFAALKREYAGSLAASMQQAGSGVPTASGVPLRKDYIESPQGNWALGRVMAGTTPAFRVDATSRAKADGLWDEFMAAWEKSGAGPALIDSFQSFGAIFTEALDFNNPKPFGQRELERVFDFIENIVLALLKLCDAVIHAGIAVVKGGFSILEEMLWKPLDIFPFDKLFAWFQSCLPTPPATPEKLSLGALVSFVMAFPVTSVYKLMNGPDKSPFPGGKVPATTPHADQLGDLGGTLLTGFIFIVQGAYVFLDVAADIEVLEGKPGENTFNWATAITPLLLVLPTMPMFSVDSKGDFSIVIESSDAMTTQWVNWAVSTGISGFNLLMMWKLDKLLRNWRPNKITQVNVGAGILGFLGILNYISFAFECAYNPKDAATYKAGNGLLMASGALQILRIPPPFGTLGKTLYLAKAGADFVCDLSGAILRLIGVDDGDSSVAELRAA